MFELRTLGTVDLRGPEGHELRSVLVQPKRLALLTYLASATPEGFHRRDELVALFWPEHDQEHARTALRKALHFLRHSLGDGVIIARGAEEVGLDSAALRCDAVVFETTLEKAHAQEALEWYRGEFLNGFHVSHCPYFERWIEERRSRLRELAAGAAWSLAEQAAATGKSREAASWGQRAVELSPEGEGQVRALIELLDQVGDRAAAINAYENLARRLRDDYGATPSPETTARVHAVRARAEVNGTENSGVPAPSSSSGAAAAQAGLPQAAPRIGAHRRRYARVAVGILALGTLALAAGLAFRAAERSRITPLPNRVVVVPFENQTGDSSLAPIGRMTADWIIEGLAQTGVVQVITLPTALRATRRATVEHADLSGAERGREVAAAVGAGTAISGAYFREGDRLVIHTQVAEARSGTLLGVVGPVSGSAADIGGALETLRQRVMGLLAIRFDQRLAPWAADIRQPPLYRAYVEYVQGLEATSFVEKSRHFVRATEFDPSFVRAWLNAVGYMDPEEERDWEAWRDSGFAVLKRSRDAMSPADRLHLDATEASLRQDWPAQYRAFRQAAFYAPDKRPDLAVAAFNLGRYRETVDVWLSEETPRILQPPDPVATKQVTAALHFLGEHERELALARQGKREHPGHINFYEMETTALAALGRLADLEGAVQEALYSGPTSGWYDPSTFLFITGIELLWHGHDSVARGFLEQAEGLRRAVVDTRTARPQTDRPGPEGGTPSSDVRRLAEVLRYLGRWDEARPILRELYAQDGRPKDLASVGIAAARSGRRDEALRIMQELARLRWPSSWERSWNQAYVAGALEDCELMVTLLRKAFSEGAFYQYLHRRLGFYFCRNHPGFLELARPRG